MDGVTLAVGALIVLTIAMWWEVAAVGAVIALGYQGVGWLQTGKWTSYTLASELKLAADPQWTHWVMVDRFIHYLLFDVELAFVVIAAAVVVSPIKGWLESAPKPSPRPAPSLPPASAPPRGPL